MPTLRELYLQQKQQPKPAPPVVDDAVVPQPAKATRQGAFRIANFIQRARPHKTVVVFNIYGNDHWFVRSFDEAALRRLLMDAKQTHPLKAKTPPPTANREHVGSRNKTPSDIVTTLPISG